MRRIGAIVVLMTAALQAQAPGRWALVELWRSGGDTSQQVTFDAVVDMKLAANGQLLLVIGGAAPQVLILDNTGRPVRAVGGGPDATFEQPNGIVQLHDGHLVVNEPQAGRLSVLTETGDFERHIAYSRWGYMQRWDGFVHDDGSLYEPVAANGQLIWRRWSADLTSAELLPASSCDFGLVAEAPAASFEISSARGGTVLAVPFLQPNVSLARSRNGTTWVGIGPDYRRILRTPWRGCDAEAIVELAGDALELPAATRLAEQARIRQVAADLGAPMPDVERIPQVFPPFHALRIDRQNRVWVERHATAATRTFSVFAPDGPPLVEVDIPVPVDTFRPVAFGDNQIYYFTEDGSGWVWLVAMRIVGVE